MVEFCWITLREASDVRLNPTYPLSASSDGISIRNYCCYTNGMNRDEICERYAAGERNFRGLDLAGINLSQFNLAGADLSQSNLSGARLNGACLHKALLKGANLQNADLQSADLVDADLSGANLTNADLRAAFLWRTNLTSAKLHGTKLHWAALTQVVPADIDLSSAIVSRTVLPSGSPSNEQR